MSRTKIQTTSKSVTVSRKKLLGLIGIHDVTSKRNSSMIIYYFPYAYPHHSSCPHLTHSLAKNPPAATANRCDCASLVHALSITNGNRCHQLKGQVLALIMMHLVASATSEATKRLQSKGRKTTTPLRVCRSIGF